MQLYVWAILEPSSEVFLLPSAPPSASWVVARRWKTKGFRLTGTDTREKEVECSAGGYSAPGTASVISQWSTKTSIAVWAVSVSEASGMVILSKPGGLQEKDLGMKVETWRWYNALEDARHVLKAAIKCRHQLLPGSTA